MITGIAVAGFGAGALITAPIASRLIITIGVMKTFAVLGIGYFVAVTGAASFMKDPPAGYRPAGWTPSAAQQRERATRDYTLRAALGRWQWYGLWALLFLNTSAGIAIISQAAPMAQEITGVSAAVAAGLVGIISIANGSGRFLWAWFSDLIGRRWVFLIMFLVQALVFWRMPHVTRVGVHHPALLWRRLWHYAGVCCRLLRRGERGLYLRLDADCLGFCRGARTYADCQHPPEYRSLQWGASDHRHHLAG
jgi:OFA family oxalate/formate antiporter-like MFS transporter